VDAIEPFRAWEMYRDNVEQFDGASPIMLLIGDRPQPVILDLPDDSPELVAPEIIRSVHGLIDVGPGPLTQVLLSVEVTTMHVERPFAGPRTAVCIYSAGSDEYRAVIPFKRTPEGVEWIEDEGEVIVGPTMDRDPIIGALRYLIEKANK
jgi:hypothetical protein